MAMTPYETYLMARQIKCFRLTGHVRGPAANSFSVQQIH
jgi:hypothetical protein